MITGEGLVVNIDVLYNEDYKEADAVIDAESDEGIASIRVSNFPTR